jgi:Spy/CpxP family protein refolding chaperone
MNRTLGTFLLGGVLSLGMAASTALAQENAAQPGQGGLGRGEHGRGRMDADGQLKHLTEALDLTTDQQAQIKPILTARDQQRQQIFADQSLADADRHTRMKAMQEATRGKIEAVLTDAQKQKFEAMQERHDHRGGDRGGAAPAPQQ